MWRIENQSLYFANLIFDLHLCGRWRSKGSAKGSTKYKKEHEIILPLNMILARVTQPDAKLMLAPPCKEELWLSGWHTFIHTVEWSRIKTRRKMDAATGKEGRAVSKKERREGWVAAWHESAKFMRIFKRCHWDRWRSKVNRFRRRAMALWNCVENGDMPNDSRSERGSVLN